MTDIEVPEGERVTKPFKFVTGEEFAPCRQVNQTHPTEQCDQSDIVQFYHAYRSLCPGAWIEKWDDQRDNGTFPVRLDQ